MIAWSSGFIFLVNALARDQRLELVGVMNLGEVFLLGFVELHGLEADVAVALAVNNALLQGSEGLGQDIGGGAAAKSLCREAINTGLCGTRNFRSFMSDIFFDGMLGIGNEAKVGIGPAEEF